ncbi:M20/M25/M40 family metallo-hydrolase [Rhizobium sp. AU243]|uniref:M20/M25/M40 family metallo-hydrolase n=1 Tax=Rhizobium sp. AU243 TaxID=2303425 RepID=UPI0010CB8FD6|nr:M20/M25/M40 family metallo-hydrolase [Rhizobium sp. AU243]TKV70569.1 M20/M25/M40 family metallo-hydrolase [Rhizobium sp. AU243]
MTGSRTGAISRARQYFDDGNYLRELDIWLRYQTESQKHEKLPEQTRFLEEVIIPYLQRMGFDVTLHPNPIEGIGPIVVARRIEDETLPTLLSYGHGDIVTVFPSEWMEGIDPWAATLRDGRIYGRGAVDNKGQVLLMMAAQDAVMRERNGKLGFNSIFLIETAEEQGSPGLELFIEENRDALASDLLVWSDGPRVAFERQELNIGARGGMQFDLCVDYGRTGGLHSGHWGGAVRDAAVVLTHALASLTTPTGRIAVEGWVPDEIPAAVKEAIDSLDVDPVPGFDQVDPAWGQTELSTTAKVIGTTSFIILAMTAGSPDKPVNAVPGSARARCQVRYTADLDGSTVIPNLRRHLDLHGFPDIEIKPSGRADFDAWRTPPDNSWVQWANRSITETTGSSANILPNGAGSNPGGLFAKHLGIPAMKIPHSYKGCNMHGANEHALVEQYRDGFAVMAALYWDLGEADAASLVS